MKFMANIRHPFLNDGIEARAYQLESLNTALGGSTLMVMPTGFGKTAVQWMLMAEYIGKGASKILLIAPTTGLVDQQWRMATERLNIENDRLVKYTGDTPPAKREVLWKDATVVFATAQVIDNDVVSNKISLKEVALLIVDEAHHAVGNHAFAKVGRHYRRQATHPRILAATASPGTREDQIKSVAKELNIGFLHFTKKSDVLLQPYAVDLEVTTHYLELPEELRMIIQPIQQQYQQEVDSLQRLGFLAPVQFVSSKHLDQAQQRASRAIAHRDVRAYDAARKIADLRRILMVLNLLQTQGMGSTKLFLDRADEEQSDERKTSRFIRLPFISQLRQSLDDCEEFHPKFSAMKQLIRSAFELNPDGKVILFTEFRDTVDLLAQEFSNDEVITPGRFIGQSTRGSSKGMSTKEQLEQLKSFRDGDINLLIATSVGEEGLDVPAADMVLLYEPVPSAIRLIQRRGRTARQRDGSVHVLIAKDTKDVYVQNASEQQEERMHAILNKMVLNHTLQHFPSSTSDSTSFEILEDGKTMSVDEFISNEKVRLTHAEEEQPKSKVESVPERIVHSVAEPLPPEYLRSKKQKGLFDFGGEQHNEQPEGHIRHRIHPLRQTILFDASENELDSIGRTAMAEVDNLKSVQYSDQLVYLDYRESRSTLPAYLKSLGCKVELTYLPAGDIRLSERVLVERKTSVDLGQSIKDGRLLNQCRKLVAGSSRPLLVVEVGSGTEQRLHPNAILGAIAFITVDLGIPVVMTQNAMETAQFIALAKQREDAFLQAFHQLGLNTPEHELNGPSMAALMELEALDGEVPDWATERMSMISTFIEEFLVEHFDFEVQEIRACLQENPTLGILSELLAKQAS